MVMIFQWVWLGSLGKLSDYFRTLGQFRKISRWYFIAAVVGGADGQLRFVSGDGAMSVPCSRLWPGCCIQWWARR
ncbi:hypothetical protein ACU4HD_47300 [Cupriavidus basilensis]